MVRFEDVAVAFVGCFVEFSVCYRMWKVVEQWIVFMTVARRSRKNLIFWAPIVQQHLSVGYKYLQRIN